MHNDRFLIRLSALADGEIGLLDAATREEMERELAQDKNLQRDMDIFRRLDKAVRESPVPAIEEKLAKRWFSIAQCSVEPCLDEQSIAKIEQTPIPVPEIAGEKFDRVWTSIAAMTVNLAQVPELTPAEEVSAARLAESAAQLEVPQPVNLRWRECWQAIAERTIDVSVSDKGQFEQIERAAAALPIPEVVETQSRKAWQEVAKRTFQANAESGAARESTPRVSSARWQDVWQTVAEKTVNRDQHIEAPRVASATSNIERSSTRFRQKHIWLRRISFMGVAALLAFAVLFGLRLSNTDEGERTASLEIPDVLDDRYQVHVKYHDGEAEPVVCFFLKNDTAEEEKRDWNWLPD